MPDMSVETAADIASFFDEEEFAEAAVYVVPGGNLVDGTRCSVVIDRGQGRRGFTKSDPEARTSERMLSVRATELPSVVRDAAFHLLDADENPTGEVVKVAGLPKLDETAQVWTCDLIVVS